MLTASGSSTTSASARANLTFDGSVLTNFGGINVIYDSSGTTTGIIRLTSFQSSNYIQSGLQLTGSSAAPLIFGTIFAGSEWARFNSSGQFGINCNAPAYTLDVNGTSHGTSVAAGSIVTNITGGVITKANGYIFHTFYNTPSGGLVLNIPSGSVSATVLIVAGGGGGGFTNCAGGGGAGGVISNAQTLSAGSYSVTVGAGGAGGTVSAAAVNGSNSVFNGYTAIGGGAGGTNITPRNGASGGSGGGGSYGGGTGAAGTSGQGNAGGNGNSSGNNSGGGGGGAGGAGGNANVVSSSAGGSGGAGATYTIGGSSYLVAGGGGGGTDGTSGTGGSGIGGIGGSPSTSGGAGGNATANTGSGGGGGGGGFGNTSGGNGAAGIIVIAYLASQAPTTAYSFTMTGNALLSSSNGSTPLTVYGPTFLCNDGETFRSQYNNAVVRTRNDYGSYGNIYMNGYFTVGQAGTDNNTIFFSVPSDTGQSAWYSNGVGGFLIGCNSHTYATQSLVVKGRAENITGNGLGAVLIDYPNTSGQGPTLTLRNSTGSPGTFAAIAFELDGSTAITTGSTPSAANQANGYIYCSNVGTGGNNAAQIGIQLWGGSACNEIMTLTGSNQRVGINTTSPATTLDVNGGVTIRNGYRPLYSKITTGTSITPASTSYGTHYDIYTSAITGLTISYPASGSNNWSNDSNGYWVFRNNTGTYLYLIITYTAGTPNIYPSNMVIPPANSVTLMATYPGGGTNSNYVLF